MTEMMNDNREKIDPFSMSDDELRAWAMLEPPEIPLKQFYLGTVEGRCAFLLEYFNRGASALFEGVSHLWDSLAAPRAARCRQIASLSGVGGSGKRVLRLTLQQFLTHALAIDHPLPRRSDFGSLQAWHEAAMATFEADRKDVAKLCEIYSAILNGDPPAPAVASEVVSGPWTTCDHELTLNEGRPNRDPREGR